MDFIFTWKTKRKHSDLGVDFTNEMILFINVIYWIYIWGFETERDTAIPFQFDNMSFEQIYITQILWKKFNSGTIAIFTIQVAVAAFNTWLKLLLRLRITQVFGPMLKML